MEQAIVTLAWALAAILFLAAAGKIMAPSRIVDVPIAAGEALISILLVVGPYQLIASVCVLTIGVTYAVYSFVKRPDAECSCFGGLLPPSSSGVQRTRNSLLALMAISYFLLVLGADTSSVGSVSIAFTGFGLLSGLVVVVAPWLVEWSLMK